MKTFRVAVSLLAFALGTPLFAADWPQWRGPNRDDVSKETGLMKAWPSSGPKLMWTNRDAGAGFGGPAVVGDMVYLLGAEDPEKGDNEFLLAVNVKDGKQAWKTSINTGAGGYSYNWGSGPRSTPTVDGDKVYVLGAKGNLACLDAKKGTIVWEKNLVKDFAGGIPGWGYCESVLIDGDKLICTPGGKNGTLAALNKKDGELLWRSKGVTDGAQYSSVIVAEVDNVRQYIQQANQSCFGVRAADGQLLWREVKPIQYRTAVIPTPIFHDNHVFVTSGYNAGCALIKLTSDKKTGTSSSVVYSNRAIVNHHGGVVRLGDHIYGYASPDRKEDGPSGWVCLNYKNLSNDNQEAVWVSTKLGKGSVTFADGHLYCYAEQDGTIALVEATQKAWTEKSRMKLPEQTKIARRSGKIWTHPVVANGKLYLRDLDLLFCFDIKDTQ